MVARIDANGDTTRYGYDGRDRLVRVTYPDGSVVSFRYDPAGNRVRMSDPAGTTSYAYDALDRPIRVTLPNGMAVKYEYDRVGNVSAIIPPDGGRIVYAYDGRGQLSEVTADSVTTRYAYDAAGSLIRVVLANGVRTAYTYDAAGRVTDVTHTRDGELLVAYRYALDALGRPVERTEETSEDTLSVTYAYDVVGRVLSERWSDGFLVTYEYDDAGNRTRRIAGRDTTVYVYGRDNRLLVAGDTWSVYDGRGNMVRRVSSEESVAYGYDSEGRLTEVRSDAHTVGFVYRGDGSRWARIVDDDTTIYVQTDAGFSVRS